MQHALPTTQYPAQLHLHQPLPPAPPAFPLGCSTPTPPHSAPSAHSVRLPAHLAPAPLHQLALHPAPPSACSCQHTTAPARLLLCPALPSFQCQLPPALQPAPPVLSALLPPPPLAATLTEDLHQHLLPTAHPTVPPASCTLT